MIDRAIIRHATITDIPKIIAINAVAMPEHYPNEWWYKWLRENIIFVAVKNDVVGYCVGITQDYLNLRNCGIIVSVATLPEHRGQGIATALLNKTWDAMKRQGIQYCALQVRYNNIDAIRLYSRLGMTQVGIQPNYYADGTGAFIYLKRLD